jgi:hypothetical protein
MAEPAPIDEPVPIDPPPPPPPPPAGACAEAVLIQMDMATAAQLAIMALAEFGLMSNLLSLICDFMELANGPSVPLFHGTVWIPSRDFIKNRILRVPIIMPAFGNLSVINTDGSGYNERRAIEEKTPG